jgi:hypothetical protein
LSYLYVFIKVFGPPSLLMHDHTARSSHLVAIVVTPVFSGSELVLLVLVCFLFDNLVELVIVAAGLIV